MRCYRRLIYIIITLCMLSTLSWAEEAVSEAVSKDKKKKYPHPHKLHSEVISEKTVDFSMDEIKDWPEFLSSLQSKINVLPFSDEARMVIRGFKPDNLSNDEKVVVVNEANKLLINEKLLAKVKSAVAFSSETKKMELDYKKTRSKEDLKWLNRGIINDMFPQTAKKGKFRELSKITCTTCHEEYAPIEKELKEAAIDERTVMECFSKAIGVEKPIPMEECIEKANQLKKSRIVDYGPLKNFVQRSDTKGEIPFFVAVHPEDPYTFKPLLKRLVCLECHGQDRKVTKVKGSDGKIKDILIFYGLGSDKPRKEQDRTSESQKDEN